MKYFDVLVETTTKGYRWVSVIAASAEDAAKSAELRAEPIYPGQSLRAIRVELEGQEELFAQGATQ